MVLMLGISITISNDLAILVLPVLLSMGVAAVAWLQIRAAKFGPHETVWPVYGKDPKWLRVVYAVWYCIFLSISIAYVVYLANT